ncbi:MAG: OmpA family protein [Bacteroidota bacterium]|nr:OmpA family protein [Bacteroidota bacterium]
MKKYYYSYLLSLLMVFCFILTLSAQETLRLQLFGEVDKLKEESEGKKAELYAPINFEKAIKYYNEAEDYYKRGKSLEDIRESIKNSQVYFAKTIDICKVGEVIFSSLIAVRNDALSADAPKHSADLWKQAEKQFGIAARKLEDNDLENAKGKITGAVSYYRAAELEAIKTNYLSPTWELLKKADEIGTKENAPKTLANAQKLAGKVENVLQQNRYDTDEARQLAQEAKYEASHAIYLHKSIDMMNQQDKSYEDVILEHEIRIKRIANALNLMVGFDSGFDIPVATIISAIQGKDTKEAKLGDELRIAGETAKQKDAEIDNLKQQVALTEKRLGTLSTAEKKLQYEGKELQRKLDTKYEQEEIVRRVAAMFTEEEGNVLREGENIIIRLYGLTFPVGTNIIEDQYYSLLSKIQVAILKFSNCRVSIEGHTDSQGGDQANQTLSERRAKAVAEYLMANMNVDIPINHQGFGESRPVASNNTPEGRAKNRRIDVVITPAW